MRNCAFIVTGAFIAISAAQGADVVELGYDNGSHYLHLAWYTGEGSWVANDFDLSTLKTKHDVVREIKFFTTRYWPNNQFDGFRIALFGMAGDVPGSMIWPAGGVGNFVKPTGGEGFKTFWVGHFLTSPKFAAAVEQYYDYPQCDPYFTDTNETFLNHSWQKEEGTPWKKLEGLTNYPNRNLMLRVTVQLDYAEVAVSPATLGRVKALYY